MIYVVLIFIGFLAMVFGYHIIEDWKGEDSTILGIIILVFGIFLMAIGLFMTKPVKTEAKTQYQGYPSAGITKHMSIVLEEAMEDFYPEVEIEDVDLLARLCTAEMGYGRSAEEYYLTASVVWNRMNSDNFPDTLREVIYQHSGDRYQYQCVKDGHIEREWDELAWEMAEAVLEEGTTVDGIVYQAEFTQGRGIYKQIGRTYFCYE